MKLAERAIFEKNLSQSEAKGLLSFPIYDLLYCSNKIREKFFKNRIKLCSIINAKSGKCSEDCKFCSQSAHYNTSVNNYPLIDSEKILRVEKETVENLAYSLCSVTSGQSPSNEELNRLCKSIKSMKSLEPHASLGILTEEKAQKLKEAGLKMYNHNLETSRRFFPKICSTHTYKDRVNTVKIAKKYFKVCSGGIFGLGESWQDRIEMALTLKELDVDCIPLNFLNPVKGTPLENQKPIRPLDILRIIAIYRFLLPDKIIMMAGGKEVSLRDLQSWVFYAGANAALIGNYLTTKGKAPNEYLQMIKDLDFSVK